jgi:hypothetical protein
VTEETERAAIYLSLHRGENYPALDVQLAATLRDARARGRAIVRVYADVAGSLNATRRRQIVRLFERLAAEALPAEVGFTSREPADRDFLGQRAREHGFVISAGPRHITIATPWEAPEPEQPRPPPGSSMSGPGSARLPRIRATTRRG